MVAEGNVGLAFGLVAAAGAATCLGACIVWCTSLAQPRLLAASLGFAAGVMLYVSFGEILMRKSVSGFQAVSADPDAAFRWSTLCFFGGMAIIAVLDQVVHCLVHLGDRHSKRKAVASGSSSANLLAHEDRAAGPWAQRRRGHRKQQRQEGVQADSAADAPPGVVVMEKAAAGQAAGATAAAEAAAERRASFDVEAGESAAEAEHRSGKGGSRGACSSAGSDDDGIGSVSTQLADLSSPRMLPEPCDSVTGAVVAATSPEVVQPEHGREHCTACEGDPAAGTTASRTPPAVVEIMEADHHSFMLKKMGLLTALAIFIHNFPEGLATFVGALADTKVGVGLAVAIAMHNIPEGICVAMPIYYATGSRWKGFFWALLSGASEPLGALVGYLALGSGDTQLSFAIVFGLVAGMMVYISVKELIPTALRYDPQDKVATTAVVAGMAVMAASLLLFTI